MKVQAREIAQCIKIQYWQPQFDPWGHTVQGQGLTPSSCTLTTTCTSAHEHIQRERIIKKNVTNFLKRNASDKNEFTSHTEVKV